MVRERIQHRVLSSIHQTLENKVEDNFVYCDMKYFSIKGKVYLKVGRYKLPKMTVSKQLFPVFEYVDVKRELPDIIAHFSKDKEKTKKKSSHVKPTIHGLTDSKSDRYIFALITRSYALWDTVKPFNVAVKKKTELFAPKPNPILTGKAKISVESLFVATITCPGTSGTMAVRHIVSSTNGTA